MEKKKKKRIIRGIVLGLLAVFAVWVAWTNLHITVSSYEIENPKLPAEFDGYKIAQISDLHNRDWGEKLLKPLREEEPDLIVITGDLTDSRHEDFDSVLEFLEEALKIAPVYYVTGNHEAWMENYPALAEKMEEIGVNMLDDRSVFLEKGDSRINLIGLADPDFAERDPSVHEAIIEKKLESLIKKGEYNIVLCHRPELFSAYEAGGADLVLTGHAHGGQIRLPFLGAVYAPDQGFFPKYTAGVYSSGGTDMAVSRGLGNSVLSVRINNTPELVILTLRAPECLGTQCAHGTPFLSPVQTHATAADPL